MTSVSEPTTRVSSQQDPVKVNVAPGSSTQASLYIRDLDSSVTETDLSDLFGKVGTLLSVKVCTDSFHNLSLGYGYVNYSDSKDAKNAMDLFNGEILNGKPIRIMFSNQDSSSQKVGTSIFVKLLNSCVPSKDFVEMFASFGAVLSSTFPSESNGDLTRHGRIQFEQEEDAQLAISTLNGMLIDDGRKCADGRIFVRPFLSKEMREEKNTERHQRAQIISKLTKVYVRNLPEKIKTKEELQNVFSVGGWVLSASIVMDKNNCPRGFGFVRYADVESAAYGIDYLDGSSCYGKKLSVGYAKSKSERVAEFELKKSMVELKKSGRFEKLVGSKLFVLNIDDSINDEKLKELFSEFGKITTCEVVLNSKGANMGYGYVTFSNPEDATKATKELNGKLVGEKLLYVLPQGIMEDDGLDVPRAAINYGGTT